MVLTIKHDGRSVETFVVYPESKDASARALSASGYNKVKNL
jgi:hypothetical protein